MSNTDTVRPTSANTAPIHSSSISKLRSIDGGGVSLGLNESDATNWLDAFSEIFSRMAASDAAPQNQESTLESDLQQTDSTIDPSDQDRADSEDHGAEQTEALDSSTEEQVSVVLPIAEAEVIETGPVEVETIGKDIDLQTKDQEIDTLADGVPLEVESVAVVDVKPQAVEVEAPTAVVETLVGDHHREKKDGKQGQAAVIPGEQESGGAETAAITKQVSATEAVDSRIESGNFATASVDHEETAQDSGRRSRRGRDDRHRDDSSHFNADQNPAVAAASKRSGGIPISAAQSVSSESTPLPTTQNTASPADNLPKPGNVSAVAAQAAAKLAASAATSGRAASASAPTGLTSNVQPAGRATSSVADSAEKKPTTPSKNSQATEAVNRAKLIQRVSKAFQHLGPDGGHVRLRLAPAELGTVRLEMHMNERRIQARVVAESEAAASVLREHLPELRQRLESQGIQIERFQIDVDSSESEPRSSMGQEHAETQQRGQEGRSGQPHSGSSSDGNDVSQQVSRFDSHPSDFGGPIVTVPIHGGVDVRL